VKTTAVLLYDADCGFCRWAIDRLLAWDRAKRLRVVPLQDAEADRLLPGIDADTRMGSWHLVMDGQVYSGGAVVPPLLRLLPAGRPLAVVPAAFPGLTERTYRWVSRHRDRFGRMAGARCEVDPTRRRRS
jgi:predicted DCC family thiol-disulfide oxidoreductase YuxK